MPTGGKLYDDELITLRWRRKDIADSLENDWGNFGFPIPATEKNVERAMDQLGNHIDDAVYSQGWDVIHDHLDPNSFDLGVGHSVQAREFYEQVLEHAGDYDCTVNIWPAVDGGGVHVSVCPSPTGATTWPSTRSMPTRSATAPSRSATSRTSAPRGLRRGLHGAAR